MGENSVILKMKDFHLQLNLNNNNLQTKNFFRTTNFGWKNKIYKDRFSINFFSNQIQKDLVNLPKCESLTKKLNQVRKEKSWDRDDNIKRTFPKLKVEKSSKQDFQRPQESPLSYRITKYYNNKYLTQQKEETKLFNTKYYYNPEEKIKLKKYKQSNQKSYNFPSTLHKDTLINKDNTQPVSFFDIKHYYSIIPEQQDQGKHTKNKKNAIIYNSNKGYSKKMRINRDIIK